MTHSNNGLVLFRGGIIFTTIVALWPIFMVLSEATGTVEEQLLQIAQAPGLYMANFFIASLIAPAILLLMLTYAFSVKTRYCLPPIDQTGATLLAVYATLVSVSYATQYAYVPRLLAAGETELAKLWYFNSPLSVPYFLNQLGYGCFGLAALLIGYKLLFESGFPKTVGTLLWASGLLSIAAFVGLLCRLKRKASHP